MMEQAHNTESAKIRTGNSVKELIQWAKESLRFLGEREAQTNAEWLLMEVSGLSRVELYLKASLELAADRVKAYEGLVRRRENREPLSYLLGKAYFRDEILEVGPSCLIPRPETEVLVETFIEKLDFRKEDIFSFLDLATGSGAIGISILRHFQNAEGSFADVSPEALKIAQKNISRCEFANRAETIESDLFKNLSGRQWNVIFCNPPYVATSDMDKLEPELHHEPRLALDGGAEGLDFYQRIVQEAPKHLTNLGWLVFEIGKGQAQAIREMLDAAGFKAVRVFQDYAGIDRIVMAQAQMT